MISDLFKDKSLKEATEIILRHYTIACQDRINTLMEEKGLDCMCDIRNQSCDDCQFWRDGVKNYQYCLQDIKDFRRKYDFRRV